MPSAAISLATGSSTWRLTQTKVLSSLARRFFSVDKGMPSSLASSRSLGSLLSTSSGIAQMLCATTLDARIRPLRSSTRPRLAGSSSVRAKRTSP
ncbi:hypothetical protein FQZ97_951060 [compost metagenome]